MTSGDPTLSIVVPTYNEMATLRTVLDRLREVLGDWNLEIVVVDDGSADGTADFLRQNDDPRVRPIIHEVNQGKGAALRTGFANARGEIVVIQDADLEYDPKDIPSLIQPIQDGHADVVYGTRFGGPAQRVQRYWHRQANNWLTWFSNLVNNLNVSDMETGYKAFRRSVLERIHIRENRFGVEPELTAKASRLKCRIFEVPISYYGRGYSEGKKIGVRDGIRAAWCILRYRFKD